MRNFFSKFRKKRQPSPPPIHIAGIYTICGKLGLPKWANPPERSKRFVVEMLSGKHAVYRWSESPSAGSVDWAWHIFVFDHYATDAEKVILPRYC